MNPIQFDFADRSISDEKGCVLDGTAVACCISCFSTTMHHLVGIPPAYRKEKRRQAAAEHRFTDPYLAE